MKKSGNTAIIVAAGSGSRLGSGTPKQFQQLAGRQVLSYSVETFLRHPKIHQLIIVTADAFAAEVSRQYPLCQVVVGGVTRQDSVSNGLDACTPGTVNVLVHDAARPLISTRIIDDCLSALEEWEGVAPALTPIDSMVVLEGQGFKNLDRNQLRIVQTPQCFKFSILKTAQRSDRVDTDEMGLVKQVFPAARLAFIDGDPALMKITHRQDLDTLLQYLKIKVER